MAEADSNGQGSVQPNGQAPASQDNGQSGANNQPQQAQGAEPEWLNYIPQEKREDARKGWMMESDYRKKTSELAEQRKGWETERAQAKAIEDWWKGFEPTYKTLSGNWDRVNYALSNWDAIQAALQGKQAQQPQQQDHFQDWELLPGQEQAKRIADYVTSTAVETRLAEMDRKYQQTIAQRENFYQNYLSIMADAFTKKAEDPSLNIQDYVQKTLEYSFGKFNPNELAYNALTSDAKLKKQQEEWYRKGKEEGLAEERNKRQAAGAGVSPTVPVFKQQPMTREQVAESVRQQALKNGINWS